MIEPCPSTAAGDAIGKAAAPAASRSKVRRGSSMVVPLVGTTYSFSCRKNVAAVCQLVRPDACKPDHLGPLFGFIRNQLAEIGRRPCKCRTAQLCKPNSHAWVNKCEIDFLIKAVDNLTGGVPRRANAEPGTGLKSWYE